MYYHEEERCKNFKNYSEAFTFKNKKKCLAYRDEKMESLGCDLENLPDTDLKIGVIEIIFEDEFPSEYEAFMVTYGEILEYVMNWKAYTDVQEFMDLKVEIETSEEPYEPEQAYFDYLDEKER